MVISGFVVLGESAGEGALGVFFAQNLYCSGVSWARHSASLRWIFAGGSDMDDLLGLVTRTDSETAGSLTTQAAGKAGNQVKKQTSGAQEAEEKLRICDEDKGKHTSVAKATTRFC